MMSTAYWVQTYLGDSFVVELRLLRGRLKTLAKSSLICVEICRFDVSTFHLSGIPKIRMKIRTYVPKVYHPSRKEMASSCRYCWTSSDGGREINLCTQYESLLFVLSTIIVTRDLTVAFKDPYLHSFARVDFKLCKVSNLRTNLY